MLFGVTNSVFKIYAIPMGIEFAAANGDDKIKKHLTNGSPIEAFGDDKIKKLVAIRGIRGKNISTFVEFMQY